MSDEQQDYPDFEPSIEVEHPEVRKAGRPRRNFSGDSGPVKMSRTAMRQTPFANAKVKEVTVNEGIQASDLASILAALSEQQQANLQTLVEQMKKPTVLEQQKLDEEAAQKEKLRVMKVEGARREIEVRNARIAGCGHVRPDGRHAFVGQVNNDGNIRGICQICHGTFGPIKATDEQRVSGVNYHQYRGLTMDKLNRLAQTVGVA